MCWGRDLGRKAAILNRGAGECLSDDITLEKRPERGGQSCEHLGERTL